eukprot:EG_transcript_28680
MQLLNRQYAQKDRPTDILSFPNTVNTAEELTAPGAALDLGDIVLCPQYIAQQHRQGLHDFEVRVPYLLAHGICHLLGHTHYDDDRYAEMEKLEEVLMSALSAARRRRPRAYAPLRVRWIRRRRRTAAAKAAG